MKIKLTPNNKKIILEKMEFYFRNYATNYRYLIETTTPLRADTHYDNKNLIKDCLNYILNNLGNDND